MSDYSDAHWACRTTRRALEAEIAALRAELAESENLRRFADMRIERDREWNVRAKQAEAKIACVEELCAEAERGWHHPKDTAFVRSADVRAAIGWTAQ